MFCLPKVHAVKNGNMLYFSKFTYTINVVNFGIRASHTLCGVLNGYVLYEANAQCCRVQPTIPHPHNMRPVAIFRHTIKII